MKKLLIFALAALLIIPAFSLAATAQLVSVHGKLTDTLNNPYSGSKNFVLRIFTAQSGGKSGYKSDNDALKQLVCLDHPDAEICR